MAILLNTSNAFLGGNLDLTISPQLILTNNSTYTATSLLAVVTAQEVSGNGYARLNLSVQSNGFDISGNSVLVYEPVSLTASGGNISFDRAVLLADGDWVGYWDYAATNGNNSLSILDGGTRVFRGIEIKRSDSDAVIRGTAGQPSWTTTTTSFTQPASTGATVSVSVGATAWMVVGGIIRFNDGVNRGNYEVTTIGSDTAVTIKRLDSDSAGGTIMNAGGRFVASAKDGKNPHTTTTANFTQPTINANVVVSVGYSGWLAAGSVVLFQDGTNQGHYEIVSVNSETGITLKNLGYIGDATPGATMTSGGFLVASGRDGTTVHPYVGISADTTLSNTIPSRYFVDCAGGNITLALPLCSVVTYRLSHLIKRIDNTANTLTIVPSGADLIDGQVSLSLSSYESVWVNSDGSANWWLS